MPSTSVGQSAGGAQAVRQYCTDTGDYNNVAALDALVRRAGAEGWELVTVARPTPMGATLTDYVCFRRPR